MLPGVVVLPGRYVDVGDAAALLAAPSRAAFSQGLRSERRVYLANPSVGRSIALHAQPDGPRRGLFAIDPEESELLELALKAPHNGRLAPARLSGTPFFFRGEARVKKSAAFGTWLGRVLRALETSYPTTSLDFVHLGTGAFGFAVGGGQLTYLEEPVAPAPLPGRRRQVQRERLE